MQFFFKRAWKHMSALISLPLLLAAFVALSVSTTLASRIQYPFPNGTHVVGQWQTLYKLNSTNSETRFNLLEIDELTESARGNHISGIDWRMVFSSDTEKEMISVEFLSEHSLQYLNVAMPNLELPESGIYVTTELAKRHRLELGDVVYLKTTSFEVIGILPNEFRGITGRTEAIVNINKFISTEYYQLGSSIGRLIAEQSPLYFFFEQSSAEVKTNKFERITGMQIHPLAYKELRQVSYNLLLMAMLMLLLTFYSELLLTKKWLNNIQPKLALQHVLGATTQQNFLYVLKIYAIPRVLLIVLIVVIDEFASKALTDYFSNLTGIHFHSFWPSTLIVVIYLFFCFFISAKISREMTNLRNNLANINSSTKQQQASLLTSTSILVIAPVILTVLGIELLNTLSTLSRPANMPLDDLYIVQFRNLQNTDITENRFRQLNASVTAIKQQLAALPDYKVTSANGAPFSPPHSEAELVAVSDKVFNIPPKVKQMMITSTYQSVMQHQMVSGRMPVSPGEIAVSESFINQFITSNKAENSVLLKANSSPLDIVGVVKDGYWLDPYNQSIPVIWQMAKEFARGYVLIRTNDDQYLKRIQSIIDREKLTLEVHSADNAAAIKSERLIRERMLLFTLLFVALTTLLSVFFILATAIHNVVIAKSVEIKVSLALGATRRRVSIDILHSCYAVLLGSLVLGGVLSVAITFVAYPTITHPLIYVFSALLIVLLLLVASSANNIRRIYHTSPLDLFKDN